MKPRQESRLDRMFRKYGGPSPAEEGMTPEQLRTELGARFTRTLRVLLISAAIGFGIVALYVYG
ncbi:MAG: hypothetical protein ACFCUN_04790 [Hyphomicrobiaceae bacterium]